MGQILSYSTVVCGFATTQLKKFHCGGLIWAAGQTKASTELQWTAKAEGAFQALKTDMHTALALGNPDYARPFYFYVAGRAGDAYDVRMQETPTGKQPLAYYSTKQQDILFGLVRNSVLPWCHVMFWMLQARSLQM